MGAYLQTHSWDAAIAGVADRQHGVVSHAQLIGIGLGRGAVRTRLAAGRLHPVHRGVYSVSHRLLTQRGQWMAAVLAAGEGAILSHRSAAALWGLRPDSRPRVDVTVAASRRQRCGIRFHFAYPPSDETTVVHGIATTTVPRTLFDLAAVVAPHRVERAINEAEVQRLTDELSLDDLLERYPRRAGSGVIRRILARGLT